MSGNSVDNTLSPHGGALVNRLVTDREEAVKLVDECSAVLRIHGQTAREVVNIAYGFFSPLTGFMTRADVESVVNTMLLPSGHVWPLPIVCDVSEETLKQLDISVGDKVLMEYHNVPFAVMQVEDIFSFDADYMAQKIYGMDNVDHPGIKQMHSLGEKFLGGEVWLVNPPVFQHPYDKYFYTPEDMRKIMKRRHWGRVVAFHTSSVPHMGHEWLMKAAWFQHKARSVLVSCSVGGKRIGDCIDEVVLLTHHELQKSGYFRENNHITSMILWDRRYAGPKEAILHAIIRKNLGCTGHVFGKNHAHPDGFGDTYAAHFAFRDIPDLGIESVLVKEWYYCKQCGGVTYSGFCGHREGREDYRSESVCSLLSTGIKPADDLLRPEVFDTIIGVADKYGFGDGYVTEEYLQKRNPIFTLAKF
ncbi:MAG: sulfate adenylyltransferase [Desulfovibrio sp.]|nr:MAG: sulfate adenylyltransferase [Desulfovibrio sp.]